MLRFMQFPWEEIGYSFKIIGGFYVLFSLLFHEELKHAHMRFIITLDIVPINIAVVISWRLNNIFPGRFDKHSRWGEKLGIRLAAQIIIT
ncbi:MAG: hypothetical protein PVH88_24720 [Ignavibacteria bacterium]|jgi:hypothetical protein